MACKPGGDAGLGDRAGVARSLMFVGADADGREARTALTWTVAAFTYQDNGDGSYRVSYAVPPVSRQGKADEASGHGINIEVRINGAAILSRNGERVFAVRVIQGAVVEFVDGRTHHFQGIIHHIATNGGKEAWSNPHISALVHASLSGKGTSGMQEAYLVQGIHDQLDLYTKEGDQSPAVGGRFSCVCLSVCLSVCVLECLR